jgi:hypothetical protein
MKQKRNEVLNKLKQIMPGLSNKELIEQSTCFVFTQTEAITFNDEVSCRIPFVTNFKGAVKASPLIDLLNKMNENEIEISHQQSDEQNQLIIKGKRKRSGLFMEAEVNLPVDFVEQPDKQWKKLPEEFPNAVDLVKECASKDETNFQLTCVHITPNCIEACDGYQAANYKLIFPSEKSFLIRADSLKHILSMNPILFTETKSWIHFKNKDKLILSCRKYIAQYQDLSDLFKVKGVVFEFPTEMTDAIVKANVFSSQNLNENYIKVRLKKGVLLIEGKGVDGWYEEGMKIDYDKKEIEFLISPKLLIDLFKKYKQGLINENRLKVSGKNFKYVTCLG